MAQEEKEGVALAGQAVEFGQSDVVEVLCFGAASFVPAAPTGEVEVFVEAAGAGVAGEADGGGGIALVAQNFGQRGDFGAQRAFVAQGDDLGGEEVLAGEHGGIGAGCRDIGAEGLLEEGAFLGEAVELWCGESAVSVAAHVVAAQRIDAQQYDIWFAVAACRHKRGFLPDVNR